MIGVASRCRYAVLHGSSGRSDTAVAPTLTCGTGQNTPDRSRLMNHSRHDGEREVSGNVIIAEQPSFPLANALRRATSDQ
ncbi:MAG: hypothetical protein K6356_08515 [Chloroflexus sp.]